MAEPTKQEIAHVFKGLRAVGSNKVRKIINVGFKLSTDFWRGLERLGHPTSCL